MREVSQCPQERMFAVVEELATRTLCALIEFVDSLRRHFPEAK